MASFLKLLEKNCLLINHGTPRVTGQSELASV